MRIFKLGSKSIDYGLVILFLILIAFNVPYWTDAYFPRHDTLQSFSYFYHSYNHLYYNNSLPLWQSFHPYGQDAIFNNMFYAMTPMTTFSLFVGRLFNVTNGLHLFKFSVFMEQFAFLISLFLLAKALFKSKYTIFFVCLVAIGSIVWNTQIHLNFRIYSYLPLIIYLFFKFYREERGHYIWIAGLAGVIWTTGTIYMVMLWIPLLALVLGILVWHKRTLGAALFERSKANLGTFCFLILLVTTQLYTLQVSYSKLEIEPKGRTGSFVPLDVFLNWGGTTEVDIVSSSLIYGYPVTFGGINDDTGIYFGILPFLFFIAVVITSRKVAEDQKPFYRALVLGFFFLATLSLGGIFARIYYYVPPLPIYRHISLFMGLIRLMMILVSAFYFERLIKDGFSRTNIQDLAIAVLMMVALSDLLGASHIFFESDLAIHGLVIRMVVIILILLLRWLGLRFFLRHKQYVSSSLAFIVIGMILFDLVVFQIMAYLDYPINDEFQQYSSLMHVTPVEFQTERSEKVITKRQQEIYELVYGLTYPNNRRQYTLYTETNSLMQLDSCEPIFRSMGIASYPAEYYFHRDEIELSDEQRKQLLNCNMPKLRLVDQMITTKSNEEVWELIRNGHTIEENLIIVNDTGLDTPELSNNVNEDIVQVGEVNVTAFTEDFLRVEADVKTQDGWLIYADAFAPDWQATVDGVQTPIYRAYGIFKAIYLEQGQHQVEFQYRPPNLYTYVVVVVYDMLFCLLLIGVFIYLCLHRDIRGSIQTVSEVTTNQTNRLETHSENG